MTTDRISPDLRDRVRGACARLGAILDRIDGEAEDHDCATPAQQMARITAVESAAVSLERLVARQREWRA